jgi:hypothetical protein
VELLIFAGLILAAAFFLYRRSRAGGSDDDPNRAIQGMPHDLREKNFQDFGEGPMYAEIRARPKVSRESGHGKDGGG